jgi:hypothetical protein
LNPEGRLDAGRKHVAANVFAQFDGSINASAWSVTIPINFSSSNCPQGKGVAGIRSSPAMTEI